MTIVFVAPERFDRCLVRFQSGDPQAADEFQRVIRPYLTNLARKVGRQLPDDIQEEIVQQTCLDLLGNSKMKFDPGRANAKKFLVLAVRNAFRKVRADYCPPGSPTRPAKLDSRAEDRKYVVLSIDELPDSAYPNSSHEQTVRRCEVASILRLAPEPVAVALERIHYSGDALSEIAEDLNMSRFRLSRQISAYCEKMQVIAKFGTVHFAERLC
jgi:RNA polymerase sigma factor (sigma-70 family)